MSLGCCEWYLSHWNIGKQQEVDECARICYYFKEMCWEQQDCYLQQLGFSRFSFWNFVTEEFKGFKKEIICIHLQVSANLERLVGIYVAVACGNTSCQIYLICSLVRVLTSAVAQSMFYTVDVRRSLAERRHKLPFSFKLLAFIYIYLLCCILRLLYI